MTKFTLAIDRDDITGGLFVCIKSTGSPIYPPRAIIIGDEQLKLQLLDVIEHMEPMVEGITPPIYPTS